MGRGASDDGGGQCGTQQLSIHIPQGRVSVLGIITWIVKQVKQKRRDGQPTEASIVEVSEVESMKYLHLATYYQ